MLSGADFGPEPDQFDTHGDDLVGQEAFRVGAKTVRASEPLDGTLDFRQAFGDGRWNQMRIVHMFI